MKVILTKDIKGIGKKNDLKEVADGYGKNFLVGRGFAVMATPDAMAKLKTLRAKHDKEEHEELKRLQELKRILDTQSLEFTVKTDEKGTVFGSVSKDMIQKAFREHKWVTNERVDVELDHPIKQIGDHIVVVDLKRELKAKLKVIVRGK